MRLWPFIWDLRRRPLLQVLAVYLVGGVVAFQVVQSFTEGLGLPWWVPPVALVAIIAGIPVAVTWSIVRRRTGRAGPGSGLGALPTPRDSAPRLLVLPFTNLGDPQRDYLARGITEEITARLAQLRALGVISHNTALAYGGGRVPTRDIGRELQVDYVLEGSVVTDDAGGDGLPSRLRVIPQLIRVDDDTHIWSDRCDIVSADIFQVQASIAESVARALDIHLLAPERQALQAGVTDNLRAYDDYLRGQEAYGRRFSEDATRQAIAHYEAALRRDPGFAAAHAALARARVWLHSQFGRTDELPRARASVDEALRLDPELVDAHTALGDYFYYGLRDFDRADREYAWVIERQPSHSDALALRALTMRRRGEWESSITHLDEALELDPRNTVWLEGQGQTYFSLGRFDDAEPRLRRAIELAPDVAYYHLWRLWAALLRDGDVEHGRAILTKAEASAPLGALLTDQEASWLVINLYGTSYRDALGSLAEDDPSVDPALLWLARAEVAQSAGQSDAGELYGQALERMQRRVEQADTILAPYHHLGYIHARLGHYDEAIECGTQALTLLPPTTDQIDGAHRRLHFARICVVLDEFDLAAGIVDELTRVPVLLSRPLLGADPFWAPIRNLPRLARIPAVA